MRRLAAALSLLVWLPAMAATPFDVVAVTPVTPIPPTGPGGIFPVIGAPEVGLGTVGINGAAVAYVVVFNPLLPPAEFLVGVGTCDANPAGGPNLGLGCTDSVPFLNGLGAPIAVVECWIAGGVFPFGVPAVYVAQDLDENGVVAAGTDPVFGPIPAFAGGGGVPVGFFGPFFPGLPLHVIVTFGPTLPPVQTVVVCGAL